jgi:hypothetical protein
MGAAGETLYVFAWLGDGYGTLPPRGGYFDGRASFGENAVRLEDTGADGALEIHAGYGPAASETAVYRWDGEAFVLKGDSAASGVQVALRSDRAQYKPSEPVRLTFTVRNDGSAPATFEFRSGQRFDLVVLDPQGQQVWQWSAGQFFVQVLGSVTLPPGQSWSFEATWDQRDARSAPVAPARYRIEGWLTASGTRHRAAAEIDIHMPAMPSRTP